MSSNLFWVTLEWLLCFKSKTKWKVEFQGTKVERGDKSIFSLSHIRLYMQKSWMNYILLSNLEDKKVVKSLCKVWDSNPHSRK